ncbi:cation:proton antiporter domain-containing protein [Methanosphaerula subterraneus]|uniref:cation:proton antiporter domain-containing protein n=1 Tax=Methanosphaerula subterraneus TaxID=3350244 RepID=UPI003F863BD3
MITGYLANIIIIIAFALVIIAIGNRFRIPGIVGFIITGILIGPYGFGLIPEREIVDALAEIGIIFLLFTIGMQFSFRKLFEMKKIVLIGGGLQVLLTIAVVVGILSLFGVPTSQALFIGFLVCPSSTAITLKIFQDRAELESPHARVSFGIGIFQDIITIPMLVALPILAGQTSDILGSLFNLGITTALLLVFVIGSSIYVIPWFMNRITGTRNPEVFLLSIILICFAITYITAEVGLSIALGAFLAGLTLSESEYFHQAFASILPFREIFTSFFFISIGMLLDLGYMIGHPVIIIALALGVILMKAIVSGGAAFVLGHSLRTTVLSGLALANIGEFAFILSTAGKGYGLFTDATEQVFLAVAVLTMSLAPLAIAIGPRVADAVSQGPLGQVVRARSLKDDVIPPEPLRGHLVIIGYGLNGRNLAKVAKAGTIPYRIIDMNPDTVAAEREKGEPIFFGDATSPEILTHAGIETARILVIVINDTLSTRAVTSLARQMNRDLFIIVRTRFTSEATTLHELGADEVIPEEFETSVEIFTRVLKKYLIPQRTIERFVREIRADTYQMLRTPSSLSSELTDLAMTSPSLDISTLIVDPHSSVCGRSLAALELRNQYRVSVVAIRRRGEAITNPTGDSILTSGDEVVVFGKLEDISLLRDLFEGEGSPASSTGRA